jgi:hypothetical protein
VPTIWHVIVYHGSLPAQSREASNEAIDTLLPLWEDFHVKIQASCPPRPVPQIPCIEAVWPGGDGCEVFVSRAVYACRCDNPAKDVPTLRDGAYHGRLPTLHKLSIPEGRRRRSQMRCTPCDGSPVEAVLIHTIHPAVSRRRTFRIFI